ncbi:hypothetical protein QBC38DRAFT_8415 [Podospora fimiseda]|uniref:Vacuolar ATPase assembly protein VMA22 n=1 Tax=Podospora fimiseda TaxID=252190 RepID=A0AAN7BW77_9PEZI|nr:hypothetical protein QBC38DRAFT_8415 [Podospora fimiseda]
MSAESDKIDALLERYLTLLDSYTQLRNSLNAIQAGMYQHLARANFSAERGIRYYGQDYYDERMQATRKLSIVSEDGDAAASAVFAVKKNIPEPQSATIIKSEETEEDISSSGDDEPKKEETTTEKEKKSKSTDPLHWFGILTPLPLRQAQSNAIKAVEETIPQLASVSAEMASVELEVRRARKRRAKAEKEDEKKKLAELENGIGGLEVTSSGKGGVVV